MIRAAIYARLSQQRKDEDGNGSTSIDRQVKACRDFAPKRDSPL
jgi:DNA invertase Pin-like site-specific DNA recombinase